MLPLRLLSCSTLADMQRLQGEFLQQLVVDYRDEAATLSKIAGEPDQQSGTSMATDYAAGLQKAQKDAAAIIEEGKAQAARIVASAEEQANRLPDLPEEQKMKRA
jgi:cell division septum initiation protein DivIVA